MTRSLRCPRRGEEVGRGCGRGCGAEAETVGLRQGLWGCGGQGEAQPEPGPRQRHMELGRVWRMLR